jgi:hypothetical protein
MSQTTSRADSPASARMLNTLSQPALSQQHIRMPNPGCAPAIFFTVYTCTTADRTRGQPRQAPNQTREPASTSKPCLASSVDTPQDTPTESNACRVCLSRARATTCDLHREHCQGETAHHDVHHIRTSTVAPDPPQDDVRGAGHGPPQAAQHIIVQLRTTTDQGRACRNRGHTHHQHQTRTESDEAIH